MSSRLLWNQQHFPNGMDLVRIVIFHRFLFVANAFALNEHWAYMYKHTYIFKKKRTDSKQITKHQRNEINFGYKKKLIYTKVNCILWDIVLVNMCVFVNIMSQKVYLCCLPMCLNRADSTEEAPNHILLYFIIRTL